MEYNQSNLGLATAGREFGSTEVTLWRNSFFKDGARVSAGQPRGPLDPGGSVQIEHELNLGYPDFAK